jgi:hypothetical protein
MRIHLYIVCCCLSFALHGQEKPDLISDRPDQSDSPYLVPTGSLQIESGVYFDRDVTGDANTRNLAFHSTLLRYGISESIEVRLVSEYLGRYTSSNSLSFSGKGFSPITLGIKIKIAREEGWRPEIGFVSNIKLKSGSALFEPANTTTNFRLVFSHTPSKKWQVGYNVGADWSGETPQATFLGTFSACYLITQKLAAFGEVYSFFPEQKAADVRLDGGFAYKIHPMVQLDAASGIGLHEHSTDFFFTAGVSARFFK